MNNLTKWAAYAKQYVNEIVDIHRKIGTLNGDAVTREMVLKKIDEMSKVLHKLYLNIDDDIYNEEE